MKTRPIPEAYTYFCLGCGYILNEIRGNRCPFCQRAFHRALRSSVGLAPSRRFTHRCMRLISPPACALLGFLLSVVCYVGVARLVYLPLSQSWHPYLAAILAFVTLLPASLFAGSWVTGVLIQPYCRQRPWTALVFSPGVILFAVCLYYWLPNRSPMFTGLMSVLALAWVYVSVLGVMAGTAYRLRREVRKVTMLENEAMQKDEPEHEHAPPFTTAPLRRAA